MSEEIARRLAEIVDALVDELLTNADTLDLSSRRLLQIKSALANLNKTDGE